MKTHNFEDFATTSSGRRAATLLIDHKVKPEHIFATVLAEVTQILPELHECGRYTTENLCGSDTWDRWFKAEGSVAGMCLAYMVRNGMVALFKHLTPSGKGKAKYRTTPSPEPMGRVIRIVRIRRRSAYVHNLQLGA